MSCYRGSTLVVLNSPYSTPLPRQHILTPHARDPASRNATRAAHIRQPGRLAYPSCSVAAGCRASIGHQPLSCYYLYAPPEYQSQRGPAFGLPLRQMVSTCGLGQHEHVLIAAIPNPCQTHREPGGCLRLDRAGPSGSGNELAGDECRKQCRG